MKKKEQNLFISDPEEDSKIINEIQNSLEQMERVNPVLTPELHWFKQYIERSKKNSRIKLLRDLIIFWLIAITIFIITFMVMNRTPMIYFIVQFVILLSFIISNVLVKRKRQVERS